MLQTYRLRIHITHARPIKTFTDKKKEGSFGVDVYLQWIKMASKRLISRPTRHGLWEIWNRHQQSRHFYRFKMDGAMAMKTWEMSNDMESVSSLDEIFKYDRQQHQEVLQAKPWQKE